MMAMARIAIIVSTILSLFLLSHARHFGPHLVPEATSEPLEQSNDGAIPIMERTRFTWPRAVPIRGSIDPRFHRIHVARLMGIRMPHDCRHAHHRLAVTKDASMIKVPYGNDMIRFPGRHSRVPMVSHGDMYPVPYMQRNGVWQTAEVRDDKMVRTLTWDRDAEVAPNDKKEEGGLAERLRGFLSRFGI